jgi:hypothetical protein
MPRDSAPGSRLIIASSPSPGRALQLEKSCTQKLPESPHRDEDASFLGSKTHSLIPHVEAHAVEEAAARPSLRDNL